VLADVAERIGREAPAEERPEQGPEAHRQADAVEDEVGRDADDHGAHGVGSREPGGGGQRQQEQAGVREQVRAGQELAAPSADPERDVEERLVDQVGQQRAEEEGAAGGGGEGAVRARRELLSDAEVAERKHCARILNGAQCPFNSRHRRKN
jgi:hypothetical protein